MTSFKDFLEEKKFQIAEYIIGLSSVHQYYYGHINQYLNSGF